MIRPIAKNDASRDEAIALLRQGFPERMCGFWRDGFVRSAGVGSVGDWPPGYVMTQGGSAQGVMLTFASERPHLSPRHIVNLSSWFVEESQRRRAPSMLRALLNRVDATFTDLTPTPSVARLLVAFGFRRWNEGAIVALWPQRFLMPPPPGVVIAWRDAPLDAFGDFDRRMLVDHEKMGCICAALRHNGEWRPLIFLRAPVWRMPGAHLIYASDRSSLIANRRAALDFLSRKGRFALRIDADRAEKPRDCAFIAKSTGRYYRGSDLSQGIDYAYSELVFFRGL